MLLTNLPTNGAWRTSNTSPSTSRAISLHLIFAIYERVLRVVDMSPHKIRPIYVASPKTMAIAQSSAPVQICSGLPRKSIVRYTNQRYGDKLHNSERHYNNNARRVGVIHTSLLRKSMVEASRFPRKQIPILVVKSRAWKMGYIKSWSTLTCRTLFVWINLRKNIYEMRIYWFIVSSMIVGEKRREFNSDFQLNDLSHRWNVFWIRDECDAPAANSSAKTIPKHVTKAYV